MITEPREHFLIGDSAPFMRDRRARRLPRRMQLEALAECERRIRQRPAPSWPEPAPF